MDFGVVKRTSYLFVELEKLFFISATTIYRRLPMRCHRSAENLLSAWSF
jgi:hypothetical protein